VRGRRVAGEILQLHQVKLPGPAGADRTGLSARWEIAVAMGICECAVDGRVKETKTATPRPSHFKAQKNAIPMDSAASRPDCPFATTHNQSG